MGAQISFMRGTMNYWKGEAAASLEDFSRSMSDMPATNGYFEGERHLNFALALAMEGQADTALKQLRETDRQRSTGSSRVNFAVRLVGAQAFLELLRGNLSQVALLGERIREVTIQESNRYRFTREFGNYLLGYACLQRNDLEQAADLLSAVAARRYATHHAMSADALAALALTLALNGEAQAAARVLSLLLDFGIELNDTHVKDIGQSCAARLTLLDGRAAAAAWLSCPSGEPEPAGLFLWSEVPILTRARALIADGGEDSLREAMMLLGKTRKHAERWGYLNQVLEADVLLALAKLKLDRHDEALVTLAGAMPTATRGGWLRPFLEAGEPMLELLSQLPAELEQQRLVARLRNAYGELRAARLLPPQAELVEPLTPRERNILALLGRHLRNKEIARELQVSPETVKTHLRHIYEKLGVHGRREALAKAAEVLPELTSRSS
jgi:LuxR family maltose regulon positive regulatory protein